MSKRNHYRPRTEAEQAAHLDAARADPGAAMREVCAEDDGPILAAETIGGLHIVDIPGTAAQPAAAVLDPPESDPPTAAELGEPAGEPVESIQQQSAQLKPAMRISGISTVDPATVAISGGMAQQQAAVWPEDALTVDWPWGAEPNPQVGEIVGWNWAGQEVAVVVKQPDIQNSEPWRIVVEVRPMPEEWRIAKLFDLNTGQRYAHGAWYTRWNRAGEEFVADEHGLIAVNADGTAAQRRSIGGWLAVVRDG